MAIQKIAVHGADITSTILPLLVPTYFDSYEESDTPGTYNLYKGTDNIATVNKYGNVFLKYNNGNDTIQTIENSYTLDYLYVCSNGLAYQTLYVGYYGIKSFLTKDNNGDVVIVTSGIQNNTGTSRHNTLAANYKSLRLSSALPYAVADDASQITCLAPIVLIDDQASYCPNAFVAMYRENNSVAAILDIAGTKYISNGGMYLKDE